MCDQNSICRIQKFFPFKIINRISFKKGGQNIKNDKGTFNQNSDHAALPQLQNYKIIYLKPRKCRKRAHCLKVKKKIVKKGNQKIQAWEIKYRSCEVSKKIYKTTTILFSSVCVFFKKTKLFVLMTSRCKKFLFSGNFFILGENLKIKPKIKNIYESYQVTVS